MDGEHIQQRHRLAACLPANLVVKAHASDQPSLDAAQLAADERPTSVRPIGAARVQFDQTIVQVALARDHLRADAHEQAIGQGDRVADARDGHQAQGVRALVARRCR